MDASVTTSILFFKFFVTSQPQIDIQIDGALSDIITVTVNLYSHFFYNTEKYHTKMNEHQFLH